MNRRTPFSSQTCRPISAMIRKSPSDRSEISASASSTPGQIRRTNRLGASGKRLRSTIPATRQLTKAGSVTPAAVIGTEWTSKEVWLRREVKLTAVPAGEVSAASAAPGVAMGVAMSPGRLAHSPVST